MVRAATEADIPAMLAIYGPYVENTTVSFEYDVPCRRSFTQRFYEHTVQFPWLVWEEAGQVLGYAYAGLPWERAAFRWSAEASVYIAPAAQGRGIGRALYETLEAILRRQGYRMLYAVITTENAGSITFHERLGYEKIGDFSNCGYKQGRWLGVTWMAKELDCPRQVDSFPKSWVKCVDGLL